MVFVCKCSIFDHEVVYKMGHRGREMNRQKSRGTQWGGGRDIERREIETEVRMEGMKIFFCSILYSVQTVILYHLGGLIKSK